MFHKSIKAHTKKKEFSHSSFKVLDCINSPFIAIELKSCFEYARFARYVTVRVDKLHESVDESTQFGVIRIRTTQLCYVHASSHRPKRAFRQHL